MRLVVGLRSRSLLVAILLLFLSFSAARAEDNKEEVSKGGAVTYDGMSLIINGKRELLYSGSIHYPRSQPDMWPDILDRAKRGGLNMIQTYVFWNVHEPIQGKYNFSGPYDLAKFIKLIQEAGMYVTLRLGPFIQAEWNHGGLPYWLREVPGIFFRTDNQPFKEHTERYVRKIIDIMKEEKLFGPQGGPIVLGQIENEYSAVQRAYKENGDGYIRWAANLVESMKLGIPWIMCKQNDAPDTIISACNGRHCGDTFRGPNGPNKPAIWTENWTTQFRVFGDAPSQRTAEDIAFSVARFFSKGGSHVNYYMYHGGTNFGRTSAHFVTTRYYDDAPLDEYGLPRDPKYGHLKHLHNALNLCKRAFLRGKVQVQRTGPDTEIRYFEEPNSDVCVAFLANNNTRIPATINFKGQNYDLPTRSISILPDCKTVVYNTRQIVSQHSSRNFVRSETATKGLKFEMFSETLPSKFSSKSPLPSELYFLTKDNTDYGWYHTRITIDPNDLTNDSPVLRVASLGHALMVYVNGEFAGNAHGSHDEKSCVFEKPIKMKAGDNEIVIVGILTGLPDSGAYMEHRYAGPRGVTIRGLKRGMIDLADDAEWSHTAGLEGETIQVFTEEGAKKVKWEPANGKGKPLTWYKAYFDSPEGKGPVAIRMIGMGKGLIWVNGFCIGRYWMSFLSALGQPTQTEYHIPRSFLSQGKNLLVILEEEPDVKPESIDLVVIDRDTICSHIAENYPTSVRVWKRQDTKIQAKVDDIRLKAVMKCPDKKEIVKVEFASFGNPEGVCGNFTVGNCSVPNSIQVVEQHCLGKSHCSIPVDRKTFEGDKDACPNIVRSLAVQVVCAKKDGEKIEEKEEKTEKKEENEDDEEEQEDEKAG